jgi:hypothetical protein
MIEEMRKNKGKGKKSFQQEMGLFEEMRKKMIEVVVLSLFEEMDCLKIFLF